MQPGHPPLLSHQGPTTKTVRTAIRLLKARILLWI
eukprot:COSAG01_NODE_69504_length_261_cov_0.641975_1_plen_34_part_01